jgi:histidine kinase
MAEQQLIQAGKMATLGEMATGMAHELNQPLSVIKTASNFFLKKIRNKEKIKEDIIETLAEEMDNHVDRASKIINHMREFGRQSDAKKEEVKINRALQKALEIFSRQLELREIDVSMDLQEDLPIIMADSNRLEQVFINLLTNARDAIEDRYAQSNDEKAEKKIFITSRSDGKHITVEIRDTGIGLPESMHSKIFDPFFTTKKAGSGTGLGLSISYGIVRDYNGTIKVESNMNQGSAFILNFPV